MSDDIDLHHLDFIWMPSISILLNAHEDELSFVPSILKSVFDKKKIELEELEKYINIVANLEEIKNGVKINHVHKIKYCEVSDLNN